MDTSVFNRLYEQGTITADELAAVEQKELQRPVSLFTDLHALLYAGIMMLATGIGILIYKNIDTIGHAAIVTIVGLGSAGCIAYCFRKAMPFSRYKVEQPNQWFDYILLLGCLLMTTFFGYLQFQYHVFGMRWGLATFIPMILLLGIAYYFDHKGILSMGITMLGAWLGVAVDPVSMLRHGHLGSHDYVVNGVLLGLLLAAAAAMSVRTDTKAHFAALYSNFGMHVLLFSLLAAIVVFGEHYFLWFLGLAAAVAWYFIGALKARSFYYLLFASLYGYAGLSVVFIRLAVSGANDGGILVLLPMYFMASALGLTFWIKHFSNKIKQAPNVQ